jgi:hypothetical protein
VRLPRPIGKRRLAYLLVAVVIVLVIVSFALPYVGGGHSGLTRLFPH